VSVLNADDVSTCTSPVLVGKIRELCAKGNGPKTPSWTRCARSSNTFRVSYRTAFHCVSRDARLMGVPLCASCGDMVWGGCVQAVACSFIAFAAWVRQLPFRAAELPCW